MHTGKQRLAALPTLTEADYKSFQRIAERETAYGIVEQTAKCKLRYWRHWQHFCRHLDTGAVDPYFSNIPAVIPWDPQQAHRNRQEQIRILSMWCVYVRQGKAGRGHQVRVGSVQDALSAISTRFQLVALPDPTKTLDGANQYVQQIRQLLKYWRSKDPLKAPQLAVPVALTEHLLQKALRTRRPCIKRTAVADMVNIAFYYLLRVGEYAYTGKARKRTVQFRVKDVTFRDHEGYIIPNTAPLEKLLNAGAATLRITNQKNGIKGQCIHHNCNGTTYSPIKSLARRVHHILSMGGTATDMISAYYTRRGYQQIITANSINTAVKDGARGIGLFEDRIGYKPADVSSHSLRAGGAMALFLNKVSVEQIKILGRWRSNTFQDYIHEQISGFSSGLSTIMSNKIDFRNMAVPIWEDAPSEQT